GVLQVAVHRRRDPNGGRQPPERLLWWSQGVPAGGRWQPELQTWTAKNGPRRTWRGPFSLVLRGGQGRDRTGDLPLFSSPVGRSTASEIVLALGVGDEDDASERVRTGAYCNLDCNPAPVRDGWNRVGAPPLFQPSVATRSDSSD